LSPLNPAGKFLLKIILGRARLKKIGLRAVGSSRGKKLCFGTSQMLILVGLTPLSLQKTKPSGHCSSLQVSSLNFFNY
jgi:hypothetical protein